jgi:hypothetical protein
MGFDQRQPAPRGAQRGGAEIACGSKEFGSPPFPFPPPGASRGGRVPPTPEHVASQPKALARAMRRLPPQEGCRPLVDPLLRVACIAADITMKA